MRKRKAGKYIGVVFAFTVICTAAFWALSAGNVLGKFVPEEPYVTGQPESASVVVTSEGKTQKGGLGSGAEPCSSEVPTAVGQKGSETNPFVLLEIVPEKAMQQFTYLCGDVDSGMPEELDAMKIGIEACKSSDKSFVDDDQNKRFDFQNDKFFENNFGRWFKDNRYSVYKIGSKTEKEEIPFAELAKLYSYKITNKDLEKAGIDVEKFREDYEADKKEIGKLIDKYPEFFVKDGGLRLRDIAKEDSRNWDVNYEKKVVDEGEFTSYTNKTGGYLLAVEPGEGDFGFASEEDCKNWIFTKTGTAADRWKYVENKDDLPEKAKEGIGQYGFWNNDTGIGWTNTSQLYDYNEKSDITGIYMDFTKVYDNNFAIKYYTRLPEIEEHYTIDYYGLKTNEILKRALFTFKDEDDFNDFHMKVICMTPSELNELAKKDTDETLDMIERADMYSFQTIGPEGKAVNETQFFYELYHKRILGDKDYVFDADKAVRFYENDLEWDLITKILMRESENQNLPLVFNQMVGKMAETGVTQDGNVQETHMYVTEGIEGQPETRRMDVHEAGNLNNITKLYLISIQFDLLAKKDKTGMERTFTEDILPYIMKISLGDQKPKGAVKGTATTTGYYSRQLCGCLEDNWSQEKKERSYYLWNRYTFFPPGLKVNLYRCREEKDFYVMQGYLPTYFNTNANPFMDGDTQSHQSGSDGNDEKNTTIISDPSNSNTNHSSLLANKGDEGVLASNVFEVLFQIINGQSEDVENLTVSVIKQKRLYEKISDDAVLIDYSSEAKYKTDKTLYLKLEVSNMNNEAGIIKEINFLNDSGEKITLDMKEAMDENANPLKKENVYTSQGTSPLYGYRVPENGKLTFFIPYSLHDWQSGYKTVELITRARMYFEKKKRFITGKEIPHEISIGERTLFNLE